MEFTKKCQEYRRKKDVPQATPPKAGLREHSRRTFVSNLGFSLSAAIFPNRLFSYLVTQAEAPPEVLYPPVDLSYFDKPIDVPAAIRFGYAAITWNEHDRLAIEDIAAVGFRGIQLRSNVIKEFDNSPDVLRALLAKHQLTFVALSSGDLNLDQPESEELEKHVRNAKFLRDAGGKYLQVIDGRPKGRSITSEDYARLGDWLSKLGQRTLELGIPVGYHNHMGSLGETPEGVARILEASDPRYVKLELDVAHYFQGGGNPAEAIDRYHQRLLFLHIKDVKPLPAASADAGGKRPYQFVELGRGAVDLPGIFAALKRVKFRGWAVAELDGATDKSRTPKESALISKTYLEQKLGYRI